jgi:hypothetical protein
VDTVSGKRAIKLHLAYDPHGDVPLKVAFTGQRVNDITPAKSMPIEQGMTYVFDLGYYSFAWWAVLDAAGCRFVSRLKSHTRLEVTAEQAVAQEGGILADRIGLLPQRMARARRNPFADPVREITVRIATGKIIRLVTNDLDAPAEEIADLYRQRWQIELFFKWIKQNLKLARFLGTSQNAVPSVPAMLPAVESANSCPAVRPIRPSERACRRTAIGVTAARATLAGPKRPRDARSGCSRGPGSRRTIASSTGSSSKGIESTSTPPAPITATRRLGVGNRSARAPPSV